MLTYRDGGFNIPHYISMPILWGNKLKILDHQSITWPKFPVWTSSNLKTILLYSLSSWVLSWSCFLQFSCILLNPWNLNLAFLLRVHFISMASLRGNKLTIMDHQSNVCPKYPVCTRTNFNNKQYYILSLHEYYFFFLWIYIRSLPSLALTKVQWDQLKSVRWLSI